MKSKLLHLSNLMSTFLIRNFQDIQYVASLESLSVT